MQLALDYGLPLGNGILTTDTLEQAQKRAAHDGYDKGGHAVRACLSLLNHQTDFVSREFAEDDEEDA
jgi:6,7-dimethyl-8-ribityllumazine synthase